MEGVVYWSEDPGPALCPATNCPGNLGQVTPLSGPGSSSAPWAQLEDPCDLAAQMFPACPSWLALVLELDQPRDQRGPKGSRLPSSTPKELWKIGPRHPRWDGSTQKKDLDPGLGVPEEPLFFLPHPPTAPPREGCLSLSLAPCPARGSGPPGKIRDPAPSSFLLSQTRRFCLPCSLPQYQEGPIQRRGPTNHCLLSTY